MTLLETYLTCFAISLGAGSVAFWIGFRTGRVLAERAFVAYRRVHRVERELCVTALRICEHVIEELGDGAVGARARTRDDALHVIQETIGDASPERRETH